MSLLSLFTTDGRLRVDAILTDTPAYSGGEVGGYVEVPRARRPATLEFAGTPLARLGLPLLFDGLGAVNEADMEPRLAVLRAMGRKTAATTEPPQLLVRCKAVIQPTINTRWVIDSIEWGLTLRRARDQRVTQQWFTLNLLQYIPATVQLTPVAAARARKR